MKRLKLLTLLTSLVLSGCVGQNAGKVYWSKSADKDIRYAIGDYISELPVYKEGTIKESEKGTNSGTKYATVYTLSNYNSRIANTIYKTELVDNGFTIDTIESGIYRGTKSVSLEYILVVTYTTYEDYNDNNISAVSTYLYKDKTETWPTDEVKSVLGEDIPHIKGSYYYASVGNYSGTNYVIVCVYGVGSSSEDEYYALLGQNGYVTRTNSTSCNAVKHSSRINLDFYYDDYECLVIQGYLLTQDMVWPTAAIKNLLGMDLPVYSDPAVTYSSGYTYLENSKKYYTVQCEYAPSSSLNAYTNQLINAGWVKEGEDVDLPDDWPIFLSDKFARFNYGEHSIEVRYYDPSDEIIAQMYTSLTYPVLMIIIYK